MDKNKKKKRTQGDETCDDIFEGGYLRSDVKVLMMKTEECESVDKNKKKRTLGR